MSWIGGEHAVDMAGTPDRVIQLDGALVVPGFVDAHVHATDAGLALTGLDLSGTRSLAECLGAVRAFAGSHHDAVIWGHGWDETRWPENRAPTRAEIDDAVGSRPAYLSRVDVHSTLVSSALVHRAPQATGLVGWSADLPLTRDAHHAVRAAARGLLSDDQRSAAQRAFLQHCAANGIVEVHECAGADPAARADLTALLAGSGPVSVLGYLGEAVDDPAAAAELLAASGAHALGGDLSVDGAIGSRTASLSADYHDDPGGRGARYLTDAQIADHLVACTLAGIQPGFHAIGDDGVRAVADGLRAAAERLGPQGNAALAGVIPRIEHAEMPSAADIATFAATGTIASIQPLFDELWGGPDGMYVQRLGADRAAPMNPFAALAAVGVTLAIGSDAPVTPADPWRAAAGRSTAPHTRLRDLGAGGAGRAHPWRPPSRRPHRPRHRHHLGRRRGAPGDRRCG